MVNFLIGLCAAMIAAFGVYYYWFTQDAEVQAQKKSEGSSVQLQMETKRIPAGAMMEDGTLPE